MLCVIASERIMAILETYFKIKKTVLSKKNIAYYINSCEGRIEKSFPQDHHLSSLGKPRDAKW